MECYSWISSKKCPNEHLIFSWPGNCLQGSRELGQRSKAVSSLPAARYVIFRCTRSEGAKYCDQYPYIATCA